MNDEQSKMVIKNQKLIYTCLKRMNLYKSCQDYFDVGMIGLCKGAKTYNSSKGYAASTYLSKCIYNEILCSLRKKQIPTISIEECFHKNLKLSDVIKDETINLEQDTIQKDDIIRITHVINGMSDREQYVLNHYYAINGCKQLNESEIAEQLNLSQTQICRVKMKAIEKIKRELEIKQEE